MKSLQLLLTAMVLLSNTAFGQSRHWSFKPIRTLPPPTVKNEKWVRSAIDRFVLAKLEPEGVPPAKAADRITLLRRIHLDLIGLPPTPKAVQRFLADKSEAAYERAVDRLLKSPHYGERWGRHWLDVARYADSNGYESDRIRPHAWRWRDWVIDAFNADMPFDRFTIWQIAGDLLPKATLEQKIATGFHRNTLVNTEGGVDREEDRVKRTVDRTNTVGKVWLGITLGCCQCHSHKYDPLSQTEYYKFYAFFNSLAEPNIAAPLNKRMGDQIARYRRAKLAWEKTRQSLLTSIGDYRSGALLAWEKSLPPKTPRWHIVRPAKLSSATDTKFTIERDLSVFAAGPNDQEDTYTLSFQTSLRGITAVRLEVFADDRLPGRGPGRANNGNFVLSGLRVYIHDKSSQQKRRIRLQAARADFSQRERQVTSVIGDNPSDGWAIHPQTGVNHVAAFELAEKIRGGAQLTIQLDHQTHSDHNIGRFRISLTHSPVPITVRPPSAAIRQILAKSVSKRSGPERLQLIRTFGFRGDAKLTKLIESEKHHRKKEPRDPAGDTRARTVSELPQARKTHVHIRGSFLDKGELVQAGTPAFLPPLLAKGKRQPTRLDLARWIVSDTNPLTSRVIVNRIWQQYFGRGLVASDDDFGTQGDAPTHPKLLDWLATQFRQDGWKLKTLHKRIVMSATYRQSSHARPAVQAKDPLNLLLARQQRLRVEAEIVRDLALSVSGLLNPKIGGPSVRPPQPAGLAKLGFQNSVTWPVSSGGDRYRRGLYTFFQRTVPYPMLITFDAADSNVSCTRRERSNTPLQALTVWNDPVFVEAAKALGQRIAKSVPKGTDEQLKHAFELCLARSPSDKELTILRRHYRQKQKKGATKIAGLTSVGRLLLNLDEFITRE